MTWLKLGIIEAKISPKFAERWVYEQLYGICSAFALILPEF